MTIVEAKSNSTEPLPAGNPWALENLPPFPAVATRLVEILSREDINANEVGKFIAAEPVFAAEVLQLANSPLFITTREVKSISQAVIILGFERVKAITLSRALTEFLGPAMKIDALMLCWQNSLAGALLAEKLAAPCRMDRDVAYTAGLLRDIGRLALLVKYPRPYANMLAVTQDHGFDLMTTERDLFDVDHCQAGRWLMERMPMPAELADVAARHHQKPADGVFGLVELVRVADMLADALGFCAVSLSDIQPTFEEVVAELPAAAQGRLTFNPDELRAEIASRIQVLCGTPKPIIPPLPPRRRETGGGGGGGKQPLGTPEQLGMLYWKLGKRKQARMSGPGDRNPLSIWP